MPAQRAPQQHAHRPAASATIHGTGVLGEAAGYTGCTGGGADGGGGGGIPPPPPPQAACAAAAAHDAPHARHSASQGQGALQVVQQQLLLLLQLR